MPDSNLEKQLNLSDQKKEEKKPGLPEDDKPKYEQRKGEQGEKNWLRKTREWIEQIAPGETKIIKSLKTEEQEKPKSDFAMLSELWKVTSADCRAALIGEFLFNPAAFRNRYFQEKYFQERLKNQWRR